MRLSLIWVTLSPQSLGLGWYFIAFFSPPHTHKKSNLCQSFNRKKTSRAVRVLKVRDEIKKCSCWPSFLLISMSANRPTLMICQSRPRTRCGFPAMRSWASMLTTVQPIAEAELRARTRFSCKQKTCSSTNCRQRWTCDENNNGALETNQKNLLSSYRSRAAAQNMFPHLFFPCYISRGSNSWVARNVKEEARGESWYLTTSFSAVDIFYLTDNS